MYSINGSRMVYRFYFIDRVEEVALSYMSEFPWSVGVQKIFHSSSFASGTPLCIPPAMIHNSSK
jgi:hypothetical protein